MAPGHRTTESMISMMLEQVTCLSVVRGEPEVRIEVSLLPRGTWRAVGSLPICGGTLCVTIWVQ